MSEPYDFSSQPGPPSAGEQPPFPPPLPLRKRRWARWLLRGFAVLGVIFLGLMIFGLIERAGRLSSRHDGLQEEFVGGDADSSNKIAIVSISGLIADTSGGLFSDEGNFRHVVQQLEKAREDENVVAVLLEVNSGGGSVTSSDIILHEVERVKAAKKRVVVWMADVAASGGYYVSCKADRIYACPTTITGSIGVILSLYNMEELAEKIGIRPVLIKSGEFKDMGSPFREMTAEETLRFRGLSDMAFNRFKKHVAEGRDFTQSQINRIANGAILTADEALDFGLIDEIGYLEDALQDAQGTHADARVVRYHKTMGFLSLLLSGAPASRPEVRLSLETPFEALTPGLYYIWLPAAGFQP